MNSHNPFWDHLADSQQKDRLRSEVEQWRQAFQESLVGWGETIPQEWQGDVEALVGGIQQLDLDLLFQQPWSEARDSLAQLQEQGHRLRQDYLQSLGPTPLACLNAVVQVLQQLEGPASLPRVGSVLLQESRQFQLWAQQNEVAGVACEALQTWLESLPMALLRGELPGVDEVCGQLTELWVKLEGEHEQASRELALQGPTRSLRWNSWILLLKSCENGAIDPGPVLETLETLDADVEELANRFADLPELLDAVEDYREASSQLRERLQQGKSLQGWSQIVPPLLVELDQLVPHIEQPPSPPSRVRLLCQDFEAGQLSLEAFHRELQNCSQELLESRKRSNVQAPQHPLEAAFVEALGKMEGGLEILTSVDRSGQSSRLEMGCTLVEEGLTALQQLDSGTLKES